MSIDWNRFRSFVYGTWEPEVLRAVMTTVKPGMTVIDIGAHIGYYTLLFAKCVSPNGQVVAFEPLPVNFELLKRNIQLNELACVQTFSQAVFSRNEEIILTVPSSSASELQNRTWDYPIRNLLGAFSYERWPYGYGIGTTSLGTQYVARIFHAKPPTMGVESGFGTLIIEMGIGGLLLWFVMSFAILFSAWRVVKKMRSSPMFPLAFMIFWYAGLLLLPMTFNGMQPYQDFVLNAYLWLLLGILFRLPSLALSAQYAAVSQIPAAAQNSAAYAPRMR